MRPLRKQADKPHPQEKKEDAASSEESQTAPEAHEDHTLDYDYSNFFWGSGDDAFGILGPFQSWFDQAEPAGYYLFGQPMGTAPRARVDIVEQKNFTELKGLVNFASYNYLGLSSHPEVIDASVEATRKYGTGASGSPILSGTLDIHDEFAANLARFKGQEEVLLFPSGYSGNLGIIAGLMRSGDLVVTDQYAHASIVDGIILSKAKVRYFRHNSAADLERKLRGFDGRKLVILEGVYSMDGDLAKLPEIVEVCRRNKARLMIDEAHSAFLFGEHGRGIAEHFGLEDAIDIHFGTFSKSLGGQGGYVAGAKKLISYLRGFARSHVFSCSLTPGVVAGLLQALKIVEREPERRRRLWENTDYLQQALRDRNVDVGLSESQVIPIMIRDDDRIFSIAEDIIHEGVYLNPVRYPAVGKHRSRLRISVTSDHTRDELTEGADVIARVLERHGFLCP